MRSQRVRMMRRKNPWSGGLPAQVCTWIDGTAVGTGQPGRKGALEIPDCCIWQLGFPLNPSVLQLQSTRDPQQRQICDDSFAVPL